MKGGVSSSQHMARVNVPQEQWLEFRAIAIRSKRSVAAYVGHLVMKELRRVELVEWKRAQRLEEQAAADPEHTDEVDETWVPPWEV